MEIFLFGRFIPANESISGFDGPCRRSPPHAGYRSFIYKGHIFEMISDNLSITEIMMLLNQTVVKRLKSGISDQLDFNGREVREFSL